MNSYLVDVNVWLALLAIRHEHHAVARRWFRACGPGEVGMCRVVQLGVVRLLGNVQVMQDDALPASQAWWTFSESVDDERVVFLKEPEGIDDMVPTLLQYRVPTPRLVTDAYLAAFAIASHRRLVTRDRGFQQFPGLEVEILGG